jgi:F0F1-type ATP synthase assembly protein I
VTPASKAPAEEKVLERFLHARDAKKKERDEQGAQYRQYLKWSGRALEIPVSVVVGLLLGRWLGGVLGYKDYGTAIGLLFGVATAIRAMVRLARAYQKEEGDVPVPVPVPVPDVSESGDHDDDDRSDDDASATRNGGAP